MPYIGNNHIAGDHVNNFKVLDDISSYTATFDGSATSVVDITNDTIRVVEHRFIQGQRVTYTNGGGGNIGGLTTGTAYYIIHDSASTFKLATNASNAASSTAINLTGNGTGSSHTLNAAFDGINKKFKLTHGSGTGARLNNSTQINVAINNVVQRPNLDPNNFTDGFSLEDNHKIVFKTAPTNQDIFWGSIIANTLTTFDISDHKIDTFTGDGSTTEFTLSHTPANNESLMVTINGVLQHPSNASTARAYTLIASIIQFTAAPAVGDEIQVRHLGFAGATTSDVTGFYGRTGNVVLTSNDHITTGNINAGIVTATSFDGTFSSNIGGSNANFSGIVTAGTFKGGNIDAVDGVFSGNVTIGGLLTYEDVTNIDSVGIVTAREGIFLPDNKKIELGNVAGNGDLQLVHTGTYSNIYNATGDLDISSNVIRLKNANRSETHAAFINNGQAELYYDNSRKFYTSPTGITVSGSAQVTGSIDLDGDIDVDGHTNLDNVSISGITTIADNQKLHLGNDEDLELYYQTTGVPGVQINSGNASGNLTIRNQDAGQYVYIHGDNVQLRSQTNNEEFLRAQYNGAVSLSYDNVKRFETTNQGINVIGHSELDNVNITGVTTITSAAPEFHFTDTNANSDYSIVVNGGQFRIRDETNSANRLAVNSDGHVDIYGRLDAVGGFVASSNSAIEGNLELISTYPSLTWTDTNHNSDYRITNNDGQLIIYDITNGAHRLNVNADGHIDIVGHLDVGAGLDVTGNIYGTGTVIISGSGNQIFYLGPTSFKVSQYASGWTNLTGGTGPILAWDYKNGPGDLMYMGSGGNTAFSSQMALVVSDGHGFKVGKSGYDGTDFDVDSSNEFFRINTTGFIGINDASPAKRLTITTSNEDAVLIKNTNNAQYASARLHLQGPGSADNVTALVHGQLQNAGGDSYFAIESKTSSHIYKKTLMLYDHNTNHWAFHAGPEDGSSPERFRLFSDGSAELGNNTTASEFDGLRRLDIFNRHSDTDSGSLLRLITRDAGSANSTESFDIVKYRSGGVGMNNNCATGDLSMYLGGAVRFIAYHTGKIQLQSTTNNQRGLAVIAPKTQINFGTTVDKGGFLMSETNGQFGISGGAYWTGSNWVAVHTGSGQIRHDGSGQIVLCTNSGLTVGSNFTPSSKLRITATNVQLEQNIRLESVTNSTWGAGFFFGGNGYGGTSTHASCVVTNGNVHIDARQGGYGMYLNWYAGTGGTFFGNGASGQAGHISSSGNMTVSGGYSGSDLRLKENIKNITGATDIIKSLVGKTYNWKKGIGLDDWNHYGLVAQEVQKVVPDLVRDNGSQFFDKDDNLVKEFDPTESDEDRKNKGLNQSLTVNYEGVTPILVEAMKELIAKVETLEAKVAALEGS